LLKLKRNKRERVKEKMSIQKRNKRMKKLWVGISLLAVLAMLAFTLAPLL
jgi:hypothetical protein